MAKHSDAIRAFYRENSVFKDYLDAVKGVTEAPDRFHYGAMLATLGATVGRTVVLHYGPHKLYPITPVVLIGPSGIGKGEAMGIARNLLKSLKLADKDWTDDNGKKHSSNDSSTIWILQDEATPAAVVKCYTMYPWGEAVPLGARAPEIAIIAGEMATFMSKTGEKEGMVPILTKLLEQDDSYVRTLVKDLSKGQHQQIIDPTLSFMAGTTIEWMRKMMPSEMFAGGFFRRCIMICETKKGYSLPWPAHLGVDEIKELKKRWNSKLSQFTDSPTVSEMSMESCKTYWMKFKVRHDENSPEDARLIGHYNSYPQHVLRTAMTFALAEGRLNIEVDDLRCGAAWVYSLLPDILQILMQGSTFGFQENAQLLERIMIDRGRINRSALWKLIRLPERQFDELILWGKETGLLIADKVNSDDGEGGVWYKLVGKGRNTWGNRLGSPR